MTSGSPARAITISRRRLPARSAGRGACALVGVVLSKSDLVDRPDQDQVVSASASFRQRADQPVTGVCPTAANQRSQTRRALPVPRSRCRPSPREHRAGLRGRSRRAARLRRVLPRTPPRRARLVGSDPPGHAGRCRPAPQCLAEEDALDVTLHDDAATVRTAPRLEGRGDELRRSTGGSADRAHVQPVRGLRAPPRQARCLSRREGRHSAARRRRGPGLSGCEGASGIPLTSERRLTVAALPRRPRRSCTVRSRSSASRTRCCSGTRPDPSRHGVFESSTDPPRDRRKPTVSGRAGPTAGARSRSAGSPTNAWAARSFAIQHGGAAAFRAGSRGRPPVGSAGEQLPSAATILLAATSTCLGDYPLAVAVATVTLVLVTGIEGILGLGPAIFLTAGALAAFPAGRLMDCVGRVPVLAGGCAIGILGCGTAAGCAIESASLVGSGSRWSAARREPCCSPAPRPQTCSRRRVARAGLLRPLRRPLRRRTGPARLPAALRREGARHGRPRRAVARGGRDHGVVGLVLVLLVRPDPRTIAQALSEDDATPAPEPPPPPRGDPPSGRPPGARRRGRELRRDGVGDESDRLLRDRPRTSPERRLHRHQPSSSACTRSCS